MPEGQYRYCDVSVPAPLDRAFTYELPVTLRHRASMEQERIAIADLKAWLLERIS